MYKQICLITGATDGVGRAAASDLAGKGFTVVLAARNAVKAEAVKKEIVAATGNADVECMVADFKSLNEIRQLAEAFKQRYPVLDVLVNNAGITAPSRVLTEDGYETTYQVNYLSQFLLTHLLLNRLKTSEQGRIINLTSNVYTMGKFDPQNLQSENHFSTMSAYSASKLLVLLFTIELAKRLQGTRITANAVHPGIVKTQMMLKAQGLFKLISYLALPFAISPEEGAATPVYLASSWDIKRISGAYFTNCREKPVKTKFNTEQDRELLWNISMECLQNGGLITPPTPA